MLREAVTHKPVPFATLLVQGTQLGTVSGPDGTFSIPDVPATTVALDVTSQDYQPAQALVRPDQNQVTIDLTPNQQEEVVIVGRATEVQRKNLANAVTTIKGDDLNRVSAPTVDTAMQGKVSGANIQSNSGAPGGGMQVRLRGISTIYGNSSPLYVIDGVILSDVAIASGLSAVSLSTAGSNASATQDNQVNRIADLNPNDIESIEVLKGASAAAIYGSKASNGVIIINTKHGRSGDTKVDLVQRFGFSQLSNELGARTFRSPAEVDSAFGAGTGMYFSPRVFDHEAQLASQRDLATETLISLAGSKTGTDYLASILIHDEPGIVQGTAYQKQSLRLTLGHEFGERLKIRASGNLIHSLAHRGLTNNDNAGVSHYVVFASTPSFFDLGKRADGTYPINPFIGSHANPLQTVDLMRDSEDVWRMIGSIDANLLLFSAANQKLSLAGNFGVDRFDQKNDLFFPPELFFEPADGLPGTALLTTSQNKNMNFGVNLVHNYYAAKGWTATTSTGFQNDERNLTSVYIVSRNLNGGQSNVDAGTQVSLTEQRQLVRDQGGYLQEELLLLQSRLLLVGAVRAERSSADSDPDELFFYPKFAVSYRLPWLQKVLDQFKVRAAYGETGNQPLYNMKYTPLAANHNINGNPGILLSPDGATTGAPGLHPERQREIEAGMDLAAWNGRANLELSVYQRNISDLLLQRTLAPSTGFAQQFQNGGDLRNRGVELMVEGTPVKHGSFEWMTRTQFWLNRSEVTSLPVPAFTAGGFGTGYGVFRIEQGASATQIVGNNGLKPDGTCCVVSKLGDTEPDFQMSFLNNFSYKRIGISMFWHLQEGSSVINLTRALYDGAQNTWDYDPRGAARVARQGAGYADPYIEDASFLKLRELSIYYDLPESWMNTLGTVKNVRLSLSGRNLLTITSYSGLDPEVSNFGNQAIFRNIDVAPYPPSRSFWLSIGVSI